MRIADIMTRHPLAVGPDDAEADLQRLAALGRLHHVPLIEDGRLTGMWVVSAEGRLVMVGPEQVHQTNGEADADEAFEALLGGKEAVLAWEDGAPAGVVTRADAMSVIRSALARGIGRRHGRPVVVRLVGPADSARSRTNPRFSFSFNPLPAATITVADERSAEPGSSSPRWTTETRIGIVSGSTGNCSIGSG